MDSITYVFVGHGASSLEAVGDNRSGMVRFLSELSSYPHEVAVDSRCLKAEHSHAYGLLTESSSDSCLLSADAEYPTPTQRSQSYTDVTDHNADDFVDDCRVVHHHLPTTSCWSEAKHNEPDAQISASSQSDVAIQSSESLNEDHAKQPSLSFSVETETQIHGDHQLQKDDSQAAGTFTSHTDESDNVDTHITYYNQSRTTVPVQSDDVMQSGTLHVSASEAARSCVSGTHSLDEYLLHKEQLNVVTHRQMPTSSDCDSYQLMRIDHSVQNWPPVAVSARTISTQSLPYSIDDQGQLSDRTIETQTCSETRAVETQTPDDWHVCGTQTVHSNDVDVITAWMNVPLAVSSGSSVPELCTPSINRPRIELSSPSDGVVTPHASILPVVNTSCVDIYSPVVSSVPSNLTVNVSVPPEMTYSYATADLLSSTARSDGVVQTSVNSSVVSCSDLDCDVHSTQTSINDGRLLVVNATSKNLQHSAIVPQAVELASSTSNSVHEYRTAEIPAVSRLSDASTVQSLSSTLSPASNNDLEGCRRTLEEEQMKLKANRILEKYRMKNVDYAVHAGNERSALSPQCARLSRSDLRLQHSSSYSQANDSGIVDSQQSHSPLTRTLFSYSDVSCDKSSTTETSRKTAAGWYEELERLRQERQRIMDMLAREVIPSRIQVELTAVSYTHLTLPTNREV